MPSRTTPSTTGRATTSRASCSSARMRRAYEISRSPSSVSVACLPFRSSRGRPTHVFQPLDLLADGRLGPVDALARAGEAAGVDHGDETAQKFNIHHGFQSIHKSTVYVFYHLISKWEGGGLFVAVRKEIPMHPAARRFTGPSPAVRRASRFRSWSGSFSCFGARHFRSPNCHSPIVRRCFCLRRASWSQAY